MTVGISHLKRRDVAVEVGRGKGLDVLKVLGVRAIGTLIKGIVARRKRGG